MSTDRINKDFFDSLWNLRIDKCPHLVYNVVKGKTKNTNNLDVERVRKGTDSDENVRRTTGAFWWK